MQLERLQNKKRKNSMLTLFQIAKNKLQSNGQIAVKAATGILDSIIARAKIRTLEKEKKKYYIEIGKKLYDMSSGGCDIAFEEEIASINKLQKKIEQIEDSILTKKKPSSGSRIVCSGCGSIIDNDIAYCPYCGMQLNPKVYASANDEKIIEDDGKKRITLETILQQGDDEYFDPSDEGIEETVKTQIPDEDDFKNFFGDAE